MLFVIALSVITISVFGSAVAILGRYRRCPSDRILVVYGKTGKDRNGETRSAKCIHGGAAFVFPVIQDFSYLSLTPIPVEVDLKGALSKQNIRVNIPANFTVAVSTNPQVMNNAAERLLNLNEEKIKELAHEIIVGQLRLVIALMDIEEINTDRDKFLESVTHHVENELQKIGLRLINVNITDITDESGYIEQLGKEAAAQAINDAKKSVAEKNRDGNVGQANAEREERIKVAEANATAVEGENKSKILIANSDALRREQEAEAERKAIAAEKVQAAKAFEESYEAEKLAENARALKETASKEADVVVPAEIDKRKVEIDAEAFAERKRREAHGEAEAIKAKMTAQAEGIYEILTKQADGFDKIVKAAGGDPRNATSLMIVDKIEEIIRMQSEAIKNIKIDKVTVWDSGSGSENGGKSSTSRFLSDLYKSVPALTDVFDMAGLKLPDYLGSKEKKEIIEVVDSIKEKKNKTVKDSVKPVPKK